MAALSSRSVRFTRLPWPLVTITFLAGPAIAPAQDWKGMGRLFGKVQGPDGKPVENASVKLDCPQRGGGTTVTTDKKGTWAYQGLAACSWIVEFKAEGLRTHTQTVNMTSEQARMSPIDVKLEKQPGPPPELLNSIKAGDEAFKAQNWPVARENYEKVASLRPDLGPQLYPRLARIYAAEKNPQKAVEYLEKAIDSDPGNMQLRMVAAQEALDAGLTEKGMEFLKGVDDAAVADGDGYFDIAVYFLRKTDAPNAITYFSKAIAKNDKLTDAYYWRGMSYIRDGKVAEAKADMTKAAELDPSGETGAKAKRALEQLK